MSERVDETGYDDSRNEPPHTGDPRVDQVIAAVEQLEERPLDEHVGVYEAAHDQLRRALDARPGADDPRAPA